MNFNEGHYEIGLRDGGSNWHVGTRNRRECTWESCKDWTMEDKNQSDYAELNKVKVNLTDLRIQIIELMKQGHKEIPLADLLWIIKHMGEEE